MNVSRIWLIASVILNILLIGILIFSSLYLTEVNLPLATSPEDVDSAARVQDSLGGAAIVDGSDKVVCQSNKPTSGNYIRIKVFFKGQDIRLRYFILNGINYAGADKCFSYDGKDTYSMNSYLPWNNELSIPFTAIVRSTANENEVEYSIKAYDLNDKLLGQFPLMKDSGKDSIDNIAIALTVNNTINLHFKT
jgi:hypothetical protein